MSEAQDAAVADPPPQEGLAGATRTLQEVRRHCVIIYIEFRGYEGRVLIDGAKVVVGDVAVDQDDDVVTGVSWRVLPKEWRRAVNAADGKAKRAVKRVGTTFKKGVYLVPREKFAPLMDELETVRAGHDAAVAEQVATWPRVLEEFRARIADRHGAAVWDQIAPKLPTQEKVRTRYAMEVGVWPVGTDAGGAYGLVDELAGKVAALEEAVHTAALGDYLPELTDVRRLTAALVEHAGLNARAVSAEELSAHYQAAWEVTDRAVRRAVAAAFDEPRDALREAIQRFLEVVNRPGTSVRGPSLAAVRAAWDRLEGFRWLAPPELARHMNEVRARFETATPADFNAETRLGQDLVRQIARLGDDLKSTGLGTARLGGRALDLDD